MASGLQPLPSNSYSDILKIFLATACSKVLQWPWSLTTTAWTCLLVEPPEYDPLHRKRGLIHPSAIKYPLLPRFDSCLLPRIYYLTDFDPRGDFVTNQVEDYKTYWMWSGMSCHNEDNPHGVLGSISSPTPFFPFALPELSSVGRSIFGADFCQQ